MNSGEYLVYLEKEIKNLLSKGLESFLEEYKSEKRITYLYIQMWTPDWNDGEPCEHSVDWCIGEQIIDYEYYENEHEMFEGITEEQLKNSNLLNIKERDIRGVIKCLEQEYTTNKQCLIIIGGEVGIVSIIKDYNCGY